MQIRAYQNLELLQGSCVPRVLGEGTLDRGRTLHCNDGCRHERAGAAAVFKPITAQDRVLAKGEVLKLVSCCDDEACLTAAQLHQGHIRV